MKKIFILLPLAALFLLSVSDLPSGKKEENGTSCDSIYQSFMDDKHDYYRNQFRTMRRLVAYYECKNNIEKGKYKRELNELKKNSQVYNLDGVLFASDTLSHDYLLDYNLKPILKSKRMLPLHDNTLFMLVDSNEVNEITDPEILKTGRKKLVSFFHYRRINKSGKFVNNERYHDVSLLSYEYFMVKKVLSAGVIDSIGNPVIPLVYADFSSPSKGTILAKKSGKWGALTMKNQTIVPFEYDWESADKLRNEYLRGKK
ncbi:WG repeat-containing protein [Flavobacterium sp.]